MGADCETQHVDHVSRTRKADKTGQCEGPFLCQFQHVVQAFNEPFIQKLLDDKRITENPLTDSVAAVSVGLLQGQEMLDLAYLEDRDAEVDFNVVMTGRGQFVEVQSSGEESTFSPEQLTSLLALAQKGVKELSALQAAFLARQLLKL